MSALFNLKVGGTEAEDIILNNEAVEEVWVNGTQVFDSYDPAAVPNGDNRTYSANVTGVYDNWGKWYVVGPTAKATGSMSFKINSISYPNMPQRDIDSGYITSADLMMVHPKYGEIAHVWINSITNNQNSSKGRYASASGVGYIPIQTGGGEIGNYATIAWDFHARTVTINGSTYSWSPKWREGIYFQYCIKPFGYNNANTGTWTSSTVSATYSITA